MKYFALLSKNYVPYPYVYLVGICDLHDVV